MVYKSVSRRIPGYFEDLYSALYKVLSQQKHIVNKNVFMQQIWLPTYEIICELFAHEFEKWGNFIC